MKGQAINTWVRKIWARWAWPLVTFLVIGAFMIIAVVVRGGSEQSDAATPNTFLPALEPAQHVNTREWRTIAADPSGHADERVVLWGQVTAFDPTIDARSFTANVDSARHTPINGAVNYPTSVILHGDPYALRNLATGYIFTAEATVDPSAAGGGVPELTVTSLKVTDKTVG
jgi:hypothetical protein